MSRKSFWNWLGLPSYADIQDLQESARRQEKALASLVSINAEAARSIAAIQTDLSASVEQVNSTSRSMLEIVEKNVCTTIQAGIDSSRDLISAQMSDLTSKALMTIRSELDASAEQISCTGQKSAADVEKRICDIIQTCTEKSEQVLIDHTQALTERTLAAAKEDLTAAIEKAGGESREAMDNAEQKICVAIRTCTEGSRQLLSEQVDKAAESIAALKNLCDTTYGLDKDIQERVEQVIEECKTQHEFLKILLADALIDDVSPYLPVNVSSSGKEVK